MLSNKSCTRSGPGCLAVVSKAGSASRVRPIWAPSTFEATTGATASGDDPLNGRVYHPCPQAVTRCAAERSQGTIKITESARSGGAARRPSCPCRPCPYQWNNGTSQIKRGKGSGDSDQGAKPAAEEHYTPGKLVKGVLVGAAGAPKLATTAELLGAEGRWGKGDDKVKQGRRRFAR
jgi:hypothetical protein